MRTVALLGVLTTCAKLCLAQGVLVQPAIGTFLTATTNRDYVSADLAESDVIVNVAPGLIFRGDGARLKVNGAFYIDTVSYMNAPQKNMVAPRGNVNLGSTLIEQLLFLDASLESFQSTRAPGGPPAPDNSETTTQARFNPSIKRELANDFSVNGYANNTWVHTSNRLGTLANLRSDAYVQDQFLSLERKPVPFGGELHIGHQETKYANEASSAQTIDKWRGIGSYAFYGQFAVGLIAGEERTQWLDQTGIRRDVKEQVHGVNTKWRPDERTTLNATLEDRFFGTGWNAEFEHRTRFQTWSLRLVRGVTTYATSPLATQVSQPGAQPPATQPSPGGRVDPLYTETAQLEQAATASYVFSTERNTLTCSYYSQKLMPLLAPGSSPAQQSLLAPTSAQRGFNVEFSHRVTRLITADAQARWSRVNGQQLGVNGSDSKEKDYRAGLKWMLAPETTGLTGLRWLQREASSVNAINADVDVRELFMGLDHRF